MATLCMKSVKLYVGKVFPNSLLASAGLEASNELVDFLLALTGVVDFFVLTLSLSNFLSDTSHHPNMLQKSKFRKMERFS